MLVVPTFIYPYLILLPVVVLPAYLYVVYLNPSAQRVYNFVTLLNGGRAVALKMSDTSKWACAISAETKESSPRSRSGVQVGVKFSSDDAHAKTIAGYSCCKGVCVMF